MQEEQDKASQATLIDTAPGEPSVGSQRKRTRRRRIEDK
jgi:hypothetical protein